MRVKDERMRRWIAALCLLLVATPAAQAQPAAIDRYIAERDAAIARFTPERMPKLEQPQIADEEKARAALDKQLFVIIGTTPPKGFGAAKSNVGSLITGDMEFGRLDGLVFEADKGRTHMVVTTLPLFQRWLAAQSGLPKEPDLAIRSADVFTQSVQTDAAIVKFADIALDAPRSFAMLSARTQDRAPDEANEVFVAAIRGDRVFIANAALKDGIKAPACSKARAAADRKLDALEKKEFKPGKDNSAFVERMSKLRDQADADFQTCFARQAPKDPRFASAVARAKQLLDRVPTK